MYTARTGLIEHIAEAKQMLGFATVKAYQGEIAQAAQDPSVITSMAPAAFIVFESGTRSAGHGRHQMEVLCCTWNGTLDRDGNADDALQLAERTLDYLNDGISWRYEGRYLSIDLDQEPRIDTLMLTNAFAIVRLTLVVREL